MCAGKLDLYCAAAGFHPARVLPCVIDVGTNNEALRNDPMYMGLQHPRLTGNEYYEVSHTFSLHTSEVCTVPKWNEPVRAFGTYHKRVTLELNGSFNLCMRHLAEAWA